MLRQAVSLLCGIALMVAMSSKESSAQTISIFGNAVPKNPIDDDSAVTLGVKFWSSQSGTISAIRFYRAVSSPNGYVAKLYTAGGTLLASAKLARESGPVPGWQIASFAQPDPDLCKHYRHRGLLFCCRSRCVGRMGDKQRRGERPIDPPPPVRR